MKRIPILSLYLYEDYTADVTAVYYDNEKEYLLSKVITGIVLDVEKRNLQKELLSEIKFFMKENELLLLSENNCDDELVYRMKVKLTRLIDVIRNHLEEKGVET